jgi:hypothetical protein
MKENDLKRIGEIIHKHIVNTYIETITNIYEKCRNNHIDILIYKGIALSVQLYNDVYQRKSGDIDCIVKKEDVKTILYILVSDGFKLQSDQEIDFDNYEKYFSGSHLRALYKKINGFKVLLEVHVNPLFNPEKYFPVVDLFKDKQEIMIAEGNVIHTLSHNLNFICLMIHYVKHIMNFIDPFSADKMSDIQFVSLKDSNVARLNEIYLFYTKYKGHIDLQSIVEIMDKNDTIEFLELFNRHFYEIFNISLYEPNKLIEYRNTNLYLQKNLCRFLLDVPIVNLKKDDRKDLSVKYQNSFMYNPCKIITLYENQIFSEKIFVNNNAHFLLSPIHPSYSVSYSGRDVGFIIFFSFKYFMKKYVNIYFYFKRENNINFEVFSFHVDKSCNIFSENEDIKKYITVELCPDNYRVNIKIRDITGSIIRYNIVICNRDSIGDLENHFSLADTSQSYDPTKYCELHLGTRGK